jgi:predicted DNA-binding protein
MKSNTDKQIKELQYICKNLIGTIEELEDIYLKLDVLYDIKYEEGR